jgi:hypothetical protein
MSNEQTEISWDEAVANNGGLYLKFEEGKRKRIAIKNWKIVSVEKPDFDDKNKMVMQAEFQAEVVSEEDRACEKQLGMLSKRFMIAVRPFLEGKDASKPVYLSIKKIGSGNATNYDVESYTPSL